MNEERLAKDIYPNLNIGDQVVIRKNNILETLTISAFEPCQYQSLSNSEKNCSLCPGFFRFHEKTINDRICTGTSKYNTIILEVIKPVLLPEELFTI